MKSNLFQVWKKREAELGRNLTLREVSEATGISIPTLSHWMNEKPTRFRAKTVTVLCEYFGCEVGELLVAGEPSVREKEEVSG